jgi:hypothetical protein
MEESMNEAVILILQDYISEHLFEPGPNWPSYYFAERSYSRWVANEIIERVKAQPLTAPIIVIEDFIRELDNCYSANEQNEMLFSIARDAAEDIISLFL